MIDALPASGLPTLSQIQGWQTAHLRSAARRWRVTADTWTSIYDDIAADLSAKSEIVWEGDASTAAQARTKRDRDTVELLAERLYFGASIAESGAAMVDQAKEEALLVVRVAGALAFDVREDLSSRPVGHRIPGSHGSAPPAIQRARCDSSGRRRTIGEYGSRGSSTTARSYRRLR